MIVWFHRARAIGWAVVGVASFVFGFANSVTVVWIASLYANIVSDWTAAEAADNREIIEAIRRLEPRPRMRAARVQTVRTRKR